MCAEHRDDIVEHLSAYLDGELSEPEVARLERQLEADPQLRRLLEELARTAEWVRDLPVEAAPPGLRESTVAMLERDMLLGTPGDETTGLPRRSRPVLRWLATAAVVALACTAGYFTLSQAGRGPSPGDERSTLQTVQIGPEKSLPAEGPPPPKSRPGDLDALAARGEAETKKDAGDPEVAWRARRARGRLGEQDEAQTTLAKPPVADVFDESLSKEPPPLKEERGKASAAGQKPGALVSTTEAVAEAPRRPAEVPKGEPAHGGMKAPAPLERAGSHVVAAHPVRLDVEVEGPAAMYAMVGRARSTAAAGGWEMLDVAPTFEAMERTETVPETAEGRLEESGRRSAQGRGGYEEHRAVRKMVLRGRRSQFVRLIEELRGQDQQARVQLISEQNVVSSGWPQVAAAAERVGSLDVPAELSPRPDFENGRSPGVFEAPSAVNRVTSRAEQTPPPAPSEKRSARIDAAERDEQRMLSQLTDAADALDKAAGYRPPAKSEDRGAMGKDEPDRVASQPGTRASEQPDSTEAQGGGLADSLLAMMRQIDATLDPDPVVEVTLFVRAVQPTTAPAPPRDDFEPPPSLRLDGSAND
ncbi:MAG: zf-HC2 domain-containing protein [Phycisphaerales bacterium]|nr:MAG: zf-HC2 domain-containing protein [Phycisphaerales bacterium]